ncbi:4-hydroxyphenylpyruvate dioxygenase [Microbulbifer pacificus]|uniref:4-hydroxyphenylpyruvate dioxygenase n=1 Tax=Microbulbifer pacificus TaxID=407164 RepID=A0AAU0MY65_9GAMM|nr:4-hydroxyphenylpyruvate dioxygenase [Microbulbifer pacificus]WOX04827.1 4-hydroxyphenylpyruvate dioxygenase [Microbulbifer pacificus]
METVTVLGLSFIEFSASDPDRFRMLFENMGFTEFKWCDDFDVTLHCEGEVHFIFNPSSYKPLREFRKSHVRGVSGIAFRVSNSLDAFSRAVALGAEPAERAQYGLYAIKGVGDSNVYFIDESEEKSLFAQFSYQKQLKDSSKYVKVDHLTHNLFPGGIKRYKEFYGRIFGFKSLRSFDIDGAKTGLISEVIASECRNIIIPLNETKDDKSQIAEFLKDYGGEGVQHVALLSNDLADVVEDLTRDGIEFQNTPDTYYENLNSRLPNHSESVERLRYHRILLDGGESQGGGYLLQIFTKNIIGPIFFEFIQRKGNQGFGEGNFKALFESIELDQVRRGVI